MNQKTLIALNTAASYGRQGVRLLVNLALVPYILGKVGEDTYGVLLNVMAITGLLAILDIGVSGAVERYIAREAALGDDRACREYWLTSFVAYLLPSAILLLVVMPASSWIEHMIRLDPSQHGTARSLTLIAVAMLALGFPANAYRGVLRGYQRGFFIAVVEIITDVVRAGLIVVTLHYWTTNIVMVMAVTAVTTIASNFALVVAVHWHYSWARYQRAAVRRDRFGSILRFSIASFMGQVAFMLNVHLHRLLIGKILGPADVAVYYTVAIVFRDMIENLHLQFTGTMIAPVAKYQAADNLNAVRNLLLLGSKYGLILAGLLAAPIAAFAEPLLRIWLHRTPEYVQYAPLLAASVLLSLMELSRGASHAVLVGMARLRFLGVVNLVAVALDGILVIIFLEYTSWRLYGVLAATGCAILFRRTLINCYACRTVSIPPHRFFLKCVVWPLIPAAISLAAGWTIQRWYVPTNMLELLVTGTAAGGIGLLFAIFVTVTRSERAELLSILRSPRPTTETIDTETAER